MLSGQFDWGDLLLNGNGGVQRYPQPGWQSGIERKRIRVLECETDRSRSQAPLYVCARVARLPTGPRAPLHSSVTLWEETAPVKLPDEHGPAAGHAAVRHDVHSGWYFMLRLPDGWRRRITASHLSYTERASDQCQPAVKVHGVFPSDRGYVASSPRLQFHRVPRGDSAPVVTPFMQVGTYPTRNFATLGPS